MFQRQNEVCTSVLGPFCEFATIFIFVRGQTMCEALKCGCPDSLWGGLSSLLSQPAKSLSQGAEDKNSLT